VTGVQTCALPISKNRIVFSKRWDAFWAGYAPAKECQPE
jgi:hypothetical protein